MNQFENANAARQKAAEAAAADDQSIRQINQVGMVRVETYPTNPKEPVRGVGVVGGKAVAENIDTTVYVLHDQPSLESYPAVTPPRKDIF